MNSYRKIGKRLLIIAAFIAAALVIKLITEVCLLSLKEGSFAMLSLNEIQLENFFSTLPMPYILVVLGMFALIKWYCAAVVAIAGDTLGAVLSFLLNSHPLLYDPDTFTAVNYISGGLVHIFMVICAVFLGITVQLIFRKYCGKK
jgi:hypothetical protein